MNKINKVTIVGAGNVGASLSAALDAINLENSLIGKSLEQQRRAVQHTDLLLLTVQDDKIRSACESISEFLSPSTLVAHCSGSLGTEVLESAKNVGCRVASAHPLNTFPNLKAAKTRLLDTNHNTHCFISGEQQSTADLSDLFRRLGFTVHALDDKSKIGYHTACVFACNYLVSLSEASLLSAERAGLSRDDFWQAVQPLMRSTLENISSTGVTSALSGPIARGDTETVSKHRKHLNSGPELSQQLYSVLGLQTLDIATQRNELSTQTLAKLKKILS